MGHPDVLDAVLSQIDWWWSSIFRPRLDGLTEAEFFWEPAEDCWTLHSRDGRTEVDYHWPPARQAPFTTIAWRMCHIGVGCLADRTSRYFPEHAPEPWPVEKYARRTPFPASPDEAVAFLERWWHGWRAGVGSLDAEGVAEPLGEREGGFSEMRLGPGDPFVNLVLHVHRELIHHGAEIALLRDLYAAQQPRDALVSAVLKGDRAAVDALVAADADLLARYRARRPDVVLRATETGRLEAVRLAIALGFDPNDQTDGITALHHAAAGGHVDLVRALLDGGADPSARPGPRPRQRHVPR
jgi:hypothetical protein